MRQSRRMWLLKRVGTNWDAIASNKPLYCAWYIENPPFISCILNTSYLENIKLCIFIQCKTFSVTTVWSYFETRYALFCIQWSDCGASWHQTCLDPAVCLYIHTPVTCFFVRFCFKMLFCYLPTGVFCVCVSATWSEELLQLHTSGETRQEACLPVCSQGVRVNLPPYKNRLYTFLV